MIRYKLQELIEKKEFNEGRHVTVKEIAYHTGINRMTLSKLLHHRGYSTTTTNIDRLCAYFNCSVACLMEYVPDDKKNVSPVPHENLSKQSTLPF